MVSEAEARRLRFLAAKEQAGGTFSDLVKATETLPSTVYFDDSGTIMCITKEEIEPESLWTNSHVFSNEQLQILEGKNWNLFYVKKDQFVDNLFSIELRPTENIHVSAETDFLSIVDDSNSTDYDIKCTVADKQFTVEISNNLLESYKDVAVENIASNGKKVLKFFWG